MSHLEGFTQVAGEWLMKGICSQLTGSPRQLVPVHVHQWKATFFPSSGAWLWRTAKKKEVGKMKDNNLTQHRPDLTMWGLCARVDQQTEGPFSWSHRFTNPRPALPLQFNYAANTCIFTCWSPRSDSDTLQSRGDTKGTREPCVQCMAEETHLPQDCITTVPMKKNLLHMLYLVNGYFSICAVRTVDIR